MSDNADPHGPAELLLDVLLYAPVGLVLEFPRLAPELLSEPRNGFAHACRAGHRRVEAANELVHHTVERRVQQAQRAMEGLGLGLELPSWLPTPKALSHLDGGDGRGAGPTGASGPAASPEPAVAPAPSTPAGGHDTAAEAAPTAGAPGSAEPIEGPSGSELAIPDYESLSASQVMPRLESLEPAELESIRVFELHHRGRKTILNKIAQLQGG